MATYPIVRLKPGRETHLQNRHPAVYSGAIDGVLTMESGSIVEVQSSTGTFLCYAHVHTSAYICLRALTFEKVDPLEQIRVSMKKAIELRRQLLPTSVTTARRLINAEGDSIPGLIVDQYGETIVVQLTTLGMERLRAWITATLVSLCGAVSIFEKSTGAARRREGLSPHEGWLQGKHDGHVRVMEHGLSYAITLGGSQKTGMFLDQRDMRLLVRSCSAGRTVLDCCSYVGGFSLSALAGGAIAADAVDYDSDALALARENMLLNSIDPSQFATYSEDVFDFLRRRPLPHTYDFIILDPPAFAKRSSDIDQAKHAYTDLNRLAMEALPSGGLLLTCSCSYQIDPALFQTIIFHAAKHAHRRVRILQRHRMAIDHPISIYHPESDYLKSLLLWVD